VGYLVGYVAIYQVEFSIRIIHLASTDDSDPIHYFVHRAPQLFDKRGRFCRFVVVQLHFGGAVGNGEDSRCKSGVCSDRWIPVSRHPIRGTDP
jgi:hypothetical protein